MTDEDDVKVARALVLLPSDVASVFPPLKPKKAHVSFN